MKTMSTTISMVRHDHSTDTLTALSRTQRIADHPCIHYATRSVLGLGWRPMLRCGASGMGKQYQSREFALIPPA